MTLNRAPAIKSPGRISHGKVLRHDFPDEPGPGAPAGSRTRTRGQRTGRASLAKGGAESGKERVGFRDDVEGRSLNWKSHGVPVVHDVNSLFQRRATPWK